jgi:EmrB/QacA subfamily drug resistance transporter
MSTKSEGGATESARWLVTAAMMLAMTVTALEQTVVATAMPRIIADLGGGEIYTWVISAYLLAATVSTPIYGKLADLLGRKRILLFGLGLFGLGSLLSGLAQTMGQLIAFRVVQGLGAGSVMPIVLTIMGDIYTLRERAKVQGWFSAVWGVSSVAGPILGGFLTDQLTWRWVFFVTIPFGVLAAFVVSVYFREKVEHREVRPIDWAGAGLLAAGSSALLMALLLGESARSWAAPAAFGVGAAALCAVFVWWERRAADPILPLDLLGSPQMLAAIVGSFLIGTLLFGLDTYIPLYLQGVLGRSATNAGKVLMPLFLSWSISVALAARFVVRFGFRSAAIVGTLLIAAGMAIIALGSNDPARSAAFFAGGLVVIGLGFGPASLSYILTVQNSVPWNRRGVATGAITFFRLIGGALGVAILGAALMLDLSHRLPGASDLAALLRAESLAELSRAQQESFRSSLGFSLRDVFLQMTAAAAVGVVCAWKLPKGHAVTAANRSAEDGRDELLPAAAVLE